MAELERVISGLSGRKDIRCLLVESGKPGVFIAGADLHELGGHRRTPATAEEMSAFGQELFNRLDDLPFPSVAVLSGGAAGGGLELALACELPPGHRQPADPAEPPGDHPRPDPRLGRDLPAAPDRGPDPGPADDPHRQGGGRSPGGAHPAGGRLLPGGLPRGEDRRVHPHDPHPYRPAGGGAQADAQEAARGGWRRAPRWAGP